MKKLYMAVLILALFFSGYYVFDRLGRDSAVSEITEPVLEKDLILVEDFVDGIDRIFNQYIERLPGAVEDRPTWSIIFASKEKAAQKMSEHFNREVFSEGKGGLTWAQLINDYQYGIEAHKNEMLMQAGALLAADSKIENVELEKLKSRLQAAIDDCVRQNTKDIVASAVLGIAAEEITRILVTRGIAATCTATFAAAGGSSGTLAGPVGTFAGLAIGFTAGWVADYFLEKKQNEDLTAKFKAALEKARDDLKAKYKEELTRDVKALNKNYKMQLGKVL